MVARAHRHLGVQPVEVPRRSGEHAPRRPNSTDAFPLASGPQIDGWWRAANCLSVGQIYLLGWASRAPPVVVGLR